MDVRTEPAICDQHVADDQAVANPTSCQALTALKRRGIQNFAALGAVWSRFVMGFCSRITDLKSRNDPSSPGVPN